MEKVTGIFIDFIRDNCIVINDEMTPMFSPFLKVGVRFTHPILSQNKEIMLCIETNCSKKTFFSSL